MNPSWNTPPEGDFARYVERLSAKAAVPGRDREAGKHGLDVGMTPSPGPGSTASAGTAAAPRRAPSTGDAAVDAQAVALPTKVLLAMGGLLLLLVTWSVGAPVGVVVMLAAGGLWLAHKLKRVKLPGAGVAQWQKVLEEAARKQRERQQRQPK